MEKVAVIISIYKNDKLPVFKECMESLLNQTYEKGLDIWIQYDGIVDTAIDSYLKRLKKDNIFIFKREENKGLAFSLNELLGKILLKGYKYIARMDTDDISLPTRIEKQVDFLKKETNVDCVGTCAIEFCSSGDFFYKKMPITHEECRNMFKKRDCMIHPTVMFRRSYFEKAGLYPEDTYFGEDTMMWAKGFKQGCIFANLPEYLFRFRLDENFFQRRRGWKHAKSILTLRHRVNNMLGFGFKAEIFALLYATAKIMPTWLLNIIYKKLR